jgi:DNA recombination-dependent growth factor C
MISKRKDINQDTLEKEFNTRMKRAEQQSVPFDMESCLQEVTDDLTRMSDIKSKGYLAVYDHKGKRCMIDAPRNVAEDVLQLLHNIIDVDDECNQPTFEVLLTDPFLVQPLLTSYCLKVDNIPEPLALDENVKLGLKCIAGGKPTSANITIKKEDLSSKEVLNHINNGKVVHSVGLDSDGVIFFTIDHTYFINGITYESDLKYKVDDSLSEEENLLGMYTPVLPELSKLVNLLESELVK